MTVPADDHEASWRSRTFALAPSAEGLLQEALAVRAVVPRREADDRDVIPVFGRPRDGESIDASGVIPTPDGDLSFVDGVDLAHQLADSPAAQRCYLTQWFRYVNARKEQSADRCTLDAIHEDLMASGYNVGEMLVALTQTVNFRFRVNQEDE